MPRGPLGIAPAGYDAILVAFSVALIGASATALFIPLAAPAWIALPAFVLYFFRDPERAARHARAWLSPADGTIDDIREDVECEFLSGPTLRIGIYLSLFSVHVQRAPADALVTASYPRAGRRVPTKRVGYTDDNTQHVTVFNHAQGGEPVVAVRQIAGPVARGIVNVLAIDDRVEAGERFGIIRFGSRVEVFIRSSEVGRVRVTHGTRVRAGESVLAEFG